ncbi:hypothetical protein, partial [Microbulbifer sp. TYP-18]|uniref:hypothetical protein n=1 Tax=Microbulbifer sp. TYP-18 TaxID=3230024 RepID=UPI0034C679A0
PGEKTNNLRVVLVKFRPAPENTDTAVAIVELFRRSLDLSFHSENIYIKYRCRRLYAIISPNFLVLELLDIMEFTVF